MAQQYLLQTELGLEPSDPDEKPARARTHDDKRTVNLAAARQFHAREGHLNVPRKHVERLNRSAPRRRLHCAPEGGEGL